MNIGAIICWLRGRHWWAYVNSHYTHGTIECRLCGKQKERA